MAKINLNTNQLSRQKLKPINRVSINRTIPNIEVSEGAYPALALYPWKLLPVAVVDNVSDDGIVMVKGTIASLLTNQTEFYNTSHTGASGIPVPTSSGNVFVFDDATTTATDWVFSNVDDDFFGYEESVIALLVPANGGNNSTQRYSTKDDDVGLWTNSTMGPITIGANMPAGVVFQDIYMDIRGAYLNYQAHDAYGIACKGFITVPFVDTRLVSSFGSDADTQEGTIDTTTPYYAVYRKYAFLYSTSANHSFGSGQVLSSDKNGRFVPQGSGATTARTAQSVALLKACDSRFPKHLTDTVQTYPGSKVTGTDTAGIPSMLYHFAEAVLTVVDGETPSAAEVKAAVQAGKFGLARMSLIL